MKRIISVCLSLLMLILLPVPPVAAAEEAETPVSWEIDEETKTLTVFCEGDMPDYKAGQTPWETVQKTAEHLVVSEGCTGIGANAFENFVLHSVKLPDTLERIGECAFENCLFSEIALPENLKEIGKMCFFYNINLTAVTIPSGIQHISGDAFNGCRAMTAVTLPEGLKSIGEYAFQSCTSLTAITLPDGLETLGLSAFGDTGLTEITLPESIQNYGSNPFNGCHFNTVHLPENMKELPAGLFAYSTVETLTLPEGITGIGINAFYRTTVQNLVLPSTLKEIGKQAFMQCLSIPALKLPEGLTVIGEKAFQNSCVSDITFPSTLEKIGDYAFQGCQYLTSLNLPDHVKELGAGCFNACCLKEITIPAGVKEIPDYAFSNCSSLTTVHLPAELESIGESAFSGCTALTAVQMPAKLESIGRCAFCKCSALKTLELPNGLKSIASNAFQESGLREITLPASLEHTEMTPFQGCKLETVHLPDEWEELPIGMFMRCQIENLTLPSNLKIIRNSAFCQATVEKFTMPDSLREIETNAFADSTVPNLRLPAGLKKIGTYAFQNTETPETLEWPANLDIIAEGAFMNCDSLKTVKIPANVREIGALAFAGCDNLETVQLAEGIETLGDYCFAGCTSLADISVPQSVKTCGAGVFSQTLTLMKQAEESGQPFYILDGGYLLHCQSQEANVTVPDGVRFIGEHAFDNPELMTVASKDDFNKLINTHEPEGYRENTHRLSSLLLAIVNDPNSGRQIAVYQPNTVTKAVTLPDSVQIIDRAAFYGMTALESLSMADSVTKIGDYAFYNCTALTEINWSKNVESVGKYAIADTPYLSNFTDDFLLIGNCLYRCSSSKPLLQIPEGVTQICTEAFTSSDGIMVVDFPSTLKRVEAYAFYKCLNLWEINCNAEIEYIDDYACWACKILKYINGTPGTPAETYVENARITISHNRKLIFNAAETFVPTGIDNTIIYGQDNWCFGNTSDVFGKSYAMTETARDKLRDIMLTEKDWPDAKWEGSCYGLSTVMIMVKCGILKPEQLSAGAKTLHDAQPDDKLRSIINYYQFCLFTAEIQNAEPPFESQEMKLLRLIRACGYVTEGGAPVLLSTLTPNGSHALVAYGLESGTWEWNGVTYHERILIWDSNSPAALSDKSCLYYDPETLHYCLPGYQVSYPDSERTITRVIETPALFNAEPYPNLAAETNDGDVNGNGWLDVGDAVLTARVVAEDQTLQLSDAARTCTDFNGDGKTDVADLREMIHSLAFLPWLEAEKYA